VLFTPEKFGTTSGTLAIMNNGESDPKVTLTGTASAPTLTVTDDAVVSPQKIKLTGIGNESRRSRARLRIGPHRPPGRRRIVPWGTRFPEIHFFANHSVLLSDALLRVTTCESAETA